MAATWPATLPTTLSENGFSETPPDSLIRSSMSVGPAKVRQRTTSGVRTISGMMVLTSTQTGTLDTFYVTTLAGGSLTFNFDHPRTSVTEEMRFTAPPTYTPLGGDYWQADLSWEILP